MKLNKEILHIEHSLFKIINELEKHIKVEPDINGVDNRYSITISTGNKSYSVSYKTPIVYERHVAAKKDKIIKEKLVKEIINQIIEQIRR